MTEKFEKFNFEKSIQDLEKISFKDVLTNTQPIIFDTNFLFTTFEFKLDIISELQRVVGATFNLYIYEGTIDELKSVERKGDKNKKYLALISKLLHIYNFKIIKSKQKYVDNQIMEHLNEKTIIATNDSELRKKIWSQIGRAIYLRQKRYLEMK